MLLPRHFLGFWQGEFVQQSRVSLFDDHLLYSYDLNVWVIVKKSSPKNLSADCRSSVGRQSADCWPFVGRQLADRRPTGFA